MSAPQAWPPYELVDASAVAAAQEKSRRLERLYHLTQERSWDGRAVLGALVDQHGPPGRGMRPEVRAALIEVLSVLLWGELAAWSISADLALGIDEMDAKMAATAQVFDEARHFYVMRDYLMMLAGTEGGGERLEVPRLGGFARKLMLEVLGTPSLARKLVGMQLLFETNAVVMFKRIADSGVCPVLAELLPYFERDESRHVGLGVLYLPRLIARMSRAEAAGVVLFQARAIAMLIGGGVVLKSPFEVLGLDPRLMSMRVVAMQDDIVRQMVAAHGRGVVRGILNPSSGPIGPAIIDFVHPDGGLDRATATHRALHAGVTRACVAVDRALA